jgi:undecaprenyl-diphosphatase
MSAGVAIIIGVIQGLTEFLPVSSSAHISIFGQIIGGENPGAAFTAIIQIGTMLAVLVYFRKDVINILSNWFLCLIGKEGNSLQERLGSKNFDARMGWYVIAGSVPIVVIGLFFQNMIETSLRNLWITSSMLIIFGIVLYIADKVGSQERALSDLSVKSSLAFGIGQTLALIPGVSRSGGSITFGMFSGFSRESSARYSFLLSIPAVFGSGMYELYKALKTGETAATGFPGWGATILATVASFVVGYLVIIVFLKIVSTYSYKGFCVYRILLGVAVIILLATNTIAAVPGY